MSGLAVIASEDFTRVVDQVVECRGAGRLAVTAVVDDEQSRARRGEVVGGFVVVGDDFAVAVEQEDGHARVVGFM
jgi:hypothetical protein